MNLRRVVFASVLTIAALSAIGAAPANATPILNLDIHHNQTNFPPGEVAEYWFDVDNVGDTATSGLLRLELELPSGLTFAGAHENVNQAPFGGQLGWSCPAAIGASTVECTASGSIPRHADARGLVVEVAVAEDASGEPIASASVEGGGAPSAPPIAGCPAGAAACASEPTPISSEEAGFGIPPASFIPDFFEADGQTPVREAGAHPALFVTPFDFNSIRGDTGGAVDIQKIANERIRDIHVDLPPGFIGNPTAVAECTQAQFTAGQCSPASQVGRIDLRLYPISSIAGGGIYQTFSSFTNGVFNLSHPRGVITDLGFSVLGNPVHIKVSLDPSNHYAIASEVPNINETIAAFDQRLSLWGVPAYHAHDSERCAPFSQQNLGAGSTSEECVAGHEPTPFLSVPSECGVSHTMRLFHYDSWQHTGAYGPEIDYTQPGETTNCDKPRFEPEVEIEPTGKQANTPTGLDVHVKIAQNENPNALATPPVKRFTVTLPEGMSFSPSFADGLKSCTLAQMQLGNNEPVQCPDASRIGEVTLHTPLLPKDAEGSMYLAAQDDNPFHSTFALLLVLHDTEERGALIKIPGKIEVDEQTGRITTVFNDTPQFPFNDLTLKFRSGPRAPLVSPPSCGEQTIGVEVASYAQPQKPLDRSNHYFVTEGPNGTPCPPDPAHSPFAPSFEAGTLNPVAGHYSTFLFRLKREDQEQELHQVTTTLPQGLVSRLAGTTLCPTQAIDSISSALGTGKNELEHPACPASSEFGTVSAGLGAGPGPNYFSGKAYLAGPYKGAPLSLAVVFPAIAGPYDLGSEVIRTALYVDPESAQVRAVTDPFPTILHGVILRVRDVRLRLDKPQSTINPTDCDPTQVLGQLSGTGGALFNATDPFQVGSCASLSFEPKLSLRLFGGTHRGAHPKLRATVRFPEGGANTSFASVALPHSEFLDQGHIGTVCTRVQFAEEKCPADSIYGYVRAKSPLLNEVVSGPIYLRSSNHLLPDVVAAFRGGLIPVNLDGRVDSIHRGIRNSFEAVPDVPVSWAVFTFQGGAKGLLQNSKNVCEGTQRATTIFEAHNGSKLTLHPALKAKCGEAKAKAKRHKRHR